jgi:hypothetical protein
MPVSNDLFSPCIPNNEGWSRRSKRSSWGLALDGLPLNGADGRGTDDGRVRGAAAVFEPCSASVAAASVLVGEIDPGLNLSHRMFDQAHGPLAMAALVRRRRLHGLHRGFER